MTKEKLKELSEKLLKDKQITEKQLKEKDEQLKEKDELLNELNALADGTYYSSFNDLWIIELVEYKHDHLAALTRTNPPSIVRNSTNYYDRTLEGLQGIRQTNMRSQEEMGAAVCHLEW